MDKALSELERENLRLRERVAELEGRLRDREPAAAGAGEPAQAREHYLKRELYEQLRENPAIFEFLEAGSLDGLWYRDLENPDREWLSPRLKEALGYGKDEVPDASAWRGERFFPEDRAAALENFRQHCADPSHPYDQIVRYRHKDGSTVWVRSRGLAIRDAAGRPVRMFGVDTNVTALELAEERLRALDEAAPDMYLVFDLEHAGAVRECNEALAENLGMARSAILGRPLEELCHADSRIEAAAAWGMLGEGRTVENLELRLKRGDGTPLPVMFSGRVAQDPESGAALAGCWCRDISHLKRVANLEVVLEALPAGAILVDEGGRIAGANWAAGKMFGYRRDELIGQPLESLIPGSLRSAHEEHRARFQSEQATRLMGVGRDFPALRKDGSEFPVQVGLRPVSTREGSFVLAAVMDLTESQALKEALREKDRRVGEVTRQWQRAFEQADLGMALYWLVWNEPPPVVKEPV